MGGGGGGINFLPRKKGGVLERGGLNRRFTVHTVEKSCAQRKTQCML